jgi:hypothetical protein
MQKTLETIGHGTRPSVPVQLAEIILLERTGAGLWCQFMFQGGQMLKIQRSSNGRVVLTLIGELEEQKIPELEALIRSEAKGRSIVLDLKDVTLAGREAINFLERCEADGVTLKSCPAYVREWLTRQRHGS